jgi:amino acid transporter
VVRTGPGLLLVLLFAAAWLWGVPVALATAELSTLRPIEGGYYRWVREFLGEFWGFQAGVWSLISSVLDNALYPVLFGSALRYWFPDLSAVECWPAVVGFIALLTWLNVRGIRIVGAVVVFLNLFLILPLVLIVGAALFQIRFYPFVPFSAGSGAFDGLGAGLALAIWFHSGYPEVSTAAAEIERPQRTIPRVLLITTPLVVLSYILPTLAGLAAVGGWHEWTSGQFAVIGAALGGKFLGSWTFLASVASFVVIFMAYLLWWSRLAWAFAADRFLPASLVQLHPRYGTPHRVLILYGVIYALLAAFPFEDPLIVDVWVFGAYALLLVLSVLGARSRIPERGAGFSIPGGLVGAWVNVLVVAATWVVVLFSTARQQPHDALLGLLALLLGFFLYGIHKTVRRWRGE